MPLPAPQHVEEAVEIDLGEQVETPRQAQQKAGRPAHRAEPAPVEGRRRDPGRRRGETEAIHHPDHAPGEKPHRRQGAGEPPQRSAAGRGRRRADEPHADENGQQGDRGILRRQGAAEAEAGGGESSEGGAIHPPLESGDSQEEEQGDREVGGGEMAVRQNVRAEDAEEQGEQTGDDAVDGPRPEEHRRGEQHSESHDHQPSRVGVVPAIEELVREAPHLPLAPGGVVLVHPHLREQERQRRDHARQGRVVGIEPVVPQGQEGVAGRQVLRLVEGGGLDPQARDGEKGVESEPERYRQAQPVSRAH